MLAKKLTVSCYWEERSQTSEQIHAYNPFKYSGTRLLPAGCEFVDDVWICGFVDSAELGSSCGFDPTSFILVCILFMYITRYLILRIVLYAPVAAALFCSHVGCSSLSPFCFKAICASFYKFFKYGSHANNDDDDAIGPRAGSPGARKNNNS